MRARRAAAFCLVACFALGAAPPARTEPVPVRYREGLVHGFLVLRSMDGKTLASGDLYQVPRGDRVTSRMVFRFRDGSYHEEKVVFSQRGKFRFLSGRMVQRGPAFKTPMEMTIDGVTGDVTVSYEDDGERKVATEKLELPDDVANGMMGVVMKNVRSTAAPVTLSLVVATPKPRLVKLHVKPAGKGSFRVAGVPKKAVHYTIEIEIGGLAGLLAPLVGKEPPISHLYMLYGEAPCFVRSEAPLALGGETVVTELAGPSFSRAKK